MGTARRLSEPATSPTRTVRPGIELANLTDVGCQREGNEDSFGYVEPEAQDEFLRKGRLVIVADGMGGHAGGELASAAAVETVRATYLASSAEKPSAALVEAFQAAHQNIQDFVVEHPEYAGMGTTCIAAVLRDAELTYAHVGDSRLYLVRSCCISQLTEDQTVANRMLREGLLTPQEAAQHPERGVLTTALGASKVLEIEVPPAPVTLLRGDVLLLCTDGLYDLVEDHEIAAAVHAGPPAAACRALVELAKSRGGFDNITVQILRFEGKADKAS